MYDEIIVEKKYDREYKKFFTKQFVFEMLILVIIPLPFYDKYITVICDNDVEIVYLLSDFLLAFMFTRLYFFVRTAYNYSIFSDAFAKGVCKQYGLETTLVFKLRCFLSEYPNPTVLFFFFGTVLSSAYLVRIFEIEYYRHDGTDIFDHYFNAVWFTVITLTTIGYGDISPGTPPGKIITILLAFWGALLLSLLVVVMTSMLSMDANQHMALHQIKLTRQAA